MISSAKMFGGYNKRYKHFSPTLGCSMTFTVYFPSSTTTKFPVSLRFILFHSIPCLHDPIPSSLDIGNRSVIWVFPSSIWRESCFVILFSVFSVFYFDLCLHSIDSFILVLIGLFLWIYTNRFFTGYPDLHVRMRISSSNLELNVLHRRRVSH